MGGMGVTGNEIGLHPGASITFDSFCCLVKQAVGTDVWGSLKNPGQPVRKAINETKTPKTPKTPAAAVAYKGPYNGAGFNNQRDIPFRGAPALVDQVFGPPPPGDEREAWARATKRMFAFSRY